MNYYITTSKNLLKTRQSSTKPSQSSTSESDCTLLGKTLMPELGVMKEKKSDLSKISPLSQFVLSNKRYCYHIMRSVGNKYLKNLINYFYFNKEEPQIHETYTNIYDFPDFPDVYINENINTVTELIQSTKDNIKEQKILIITLKTSGNQETIPIILSEHYVLVSFMISSIGTKETESIPENDTSEYIQVTATNNSQIMLNYQYMLFPPAITKGTIFQKMQSVRRREGGNNKTIKKYRKHNRNKTTKNYN
jgi:hypothetical protein